LNREWEIDLLVPHLADEAGPGLLLVHALPAGHRGGIVLALLGCQAFEEAVGCLCFGVSVRLV